MKIVHQKGNSEIVIAEAPMPTAGPGEVIVKTVVSALCGSELGTYRKEGLPAGNNGHEAAGIVAALGEGVTTVKVGDKVGVSAISGCGHCDYCAKGQYTWCDHFKFFGHMHAEYFKVDAIACHQLPQDVPWEVSVLITGDGLGVPFHTSTKLRSEEIKTIVVFGLGPIGLSEIIVQKHLGRKLIGVDRSPDRIALAKKLGAAETILVTEGLDVPAAIKALTGGKGADVCIEAAGVPVTAKQCFLSVRKGGTVVFNGEQPALPLSPSDDFIRRDITAVGSWFYHFNEYPAMLDAYRKGLPVASLVTHQFPIDQAAEAFRLMADGKTGKVLLTYAA